MTGLPIEAIRAHAQAEYPREACGLLVVFNGRERYHPCRNTATSPGDYFRMDPHDYSDAEEQGEVTAVVHSHPDVSAQPSEADLVACEASGLPWLIVAIHKGVPGEVHRFQPNGYVAPLVGRQFSHGLLDCYTLVRDWYSREAGIVLPDFERRDDWWNDGQSNLYMDHFREVGCDLVTANIREYREPLRRGDVILMQIRSKNSVPNHAGVFLGDGRNLFLHHFYGRLSSRDVFGGMWAEATRAVVRHRSMVS
jgi:proteasome lid subunit RPN8/RPN11